jgi:hypothetical protein
VDAIDDFKSDLHAMLRRYSQKCNVHANAKKKVAKLLSNLDASFSTSGVREFMSKLELHVETRINANSACTMEVLKVSSIKPENSTTYLSIIKRRINKRLECISENYEENSRGQ